MRTQVIWAAFGAAMMLVFCTVTYQPAAVSDTSLEEIAALRLKLKGLEESAPCPAPLVAPALVAPTYPLTGKGSHPIFVTGCGHSGTSIMLRLIGQHPRVFMFNDETNVFYRGTTLERRAKLVALEAEFLANRTTEVRFVEKTPAHVDRIGEALQTRPLGRAVMLTRDGRDVVASLKARRKNPSSEEARKKEDPHWEYAVERYMYATMKTLEAAEDPRVLILRYEDLVKNTSGTLKVLFAFLEETYDENQIRSYHENQISYEGAKPDQNKKVSYEKQGDLRVHQQIRVNQINKPLYDGTGRYKEKPPTGLTQEELGKLKAHTKFMEYQMRLGYKWDD